VTDALSARYEAIGASIIGRRAELEAVLAVVSAGRDLVLEGPPGTSKSTILRAITASWGIPLLLVEGNAELTPAKLIGHHNPARVLKEDYSAENFVAGPLTDAMERGGFLYIEEFNRLPEDTLNALLTAMAERELTIPRVGTIRAKPSFRLLAAMNPYDTIGTSRISASIYDRLCRLAIDYQSAADETAITARRSGSTDGPLIDDAVALVRATRVHPEIRLGSSVRGAIDLVSVAERIAELRGEPSSTGDRDEVLLRAALLALSGRIALDDATGRAPEAIITELWEDLVLRRSGAGGEMVLDPSIEPAIALTPSDPPGRSATRTFAPLSRKPSTLTEAPVLLPMSTASGKPTRPAGAGTEVAGDPGVPARAGLTGETTIGEAEPGYLRQTDLAAGQADIDATSRWAAHIARRLALRTSGNRCKAGGGRPRIKSMPYRYNADDIDLDRTLEILAERPVPEATDIIIRDWIRTERAVVLLVDVSGSMKGAKMLVATATIAALCQEMGPREEFGVIAFWKDAALVRPIGATRGGADVIRDLRSIRAKGLTNVHFALESGLAELAKARSLRQIAILLSDVVHNAGEDPRLVAGRFDRLHVMLQVDGEHDASLGADIARLGHGSVVPIRSYVDVAPALNRLLAR
jgi:MoxR-like ATPase/Mg-chelatase subunit ChlD